MAKGNTTFGGDSNGIGAAFSSVWCVYINSNTTGQTAKQNVKLPRPEGGCIMAISAEFLSQSDRTKPKQDSLSGPADADAQYFPHSLSVGQFATLYAVVKRMISRLHEAIAAPSHVATGLDASLASVGTIPAPADADAYPVGLDALEELARTRTGYSFAELSPELQDVVLDMIASGDLSAGEVDLAEWLEGLKSHAATERVRKPDAA